MERKEEEEEEEGRRRRVNDGIIHKVTITSSSSDDQSFAKGIKDRILRQYKLFCTASPQNTSFLKSRVDFVTKSTRAKVMQADLN